MKLRHPNGRGFLLDDAEANRATFIDKTSSASGFAKLRDSTLLDSHAKDQVQIYGGTYHRTTIQGHTICAGSPQTYNSTLDCSEVSGRPSIMGCRLLGMTEVCDRPNLVGITAQDAIIYGTPSLVGNFIVLGRVHEGYWTRTPKHIKLPWVHLSECVVKNGEQHILLQCYCKPVSWFLRFGHRLAAKWEWNQDQVDITMETIRREFGNGVIRDSSGGIQGALSQDSGDVRAGTRSL